MSAADVTLEAIVKLRDDFEKWVKNPHMISRYTEPGCTDRYEHPWTCGAWEAWKKCHDALESAWRERDALRTEVQRLTEEACRSDAGRVEAPEMVLDALKDARSGWRCIREDHGDLYGIGWDRVEQKLTEAIARLSPSPQPSADVVERLRQGQAVEVPELTDTILDLACGPDLSGKVDLPSVTIRDRKRQTDRGEG